jgi:hypothetical protein
MPAALPVLYVYYAPYCAPCRLELPQVAEAARQGLAVTVVILEQEEKARRELAEVSPGLAQWAVTAKGGDPRRTLRDAGDGDGILPYAVARRRDGSSCGSWRGGLTVERIRSLLAACIP